MTSSHTYGGGCSPRERYRGEVLPDREGRRMARSSDLWFGPMQRESRIAYGLLPEPAIAGMSMA